MLLALAYFTLQERPEDDLITLLLVHGVTSKETPSGGWYVG